MNPRTTRRSGDSKQNQEESMVKQIGAGNYMYEVAEGWGEFPVDGVVADVATDSQDRVYAAVRTS